MVLTFIIAFLVVMLLQLLLCVKVRRRWVRHLPLLLPLLSFGAALVCLLDRADTGLNILDSLLNSIADFIARAFALYGLIGLAGYGLAWLVYRLALRERFGPRVETVSGMVEKPKPAPPDRDPDRYAPELLRESYSALEWKGSDGLLVLADALDIELELQCLLTECGELLEKLFESLQAIDDFVQSGAMEYDIACIDVAANSARIEYFGNRVNTQFDVEVFLRDGRWYCTQMGTKQYEPPALVAGSST